ncbi:hypothetical protein BDW59DRAFT_139117 [Aspergillus cavernicola]|uniref:Uncharacterized protein n=1 Tax=Aspergillus cavernicola TaxID=176166 RepID=A0ABR4IZ97_9EURO
MFCKASAGYRSPSAGSLRERFPSVPGRPIGARFRNESRNSWVAEAHCSSRERR